MTQEATHRDVTEHTSNAALYQRAQNSTMACAAVPYTISTLLELMIYGYFMNSYPSNKSVAAILNSVTVRCAISDHNTDQDPLTHSWQCVNVANRPKS